MRILTTIVIMLLFMFVPVVHAEDLYIATDAVGGGTGADCDNALDYTFFNDSGNWGGGVGEIDPADTVHVCGTIVTAANTAALTFQASGTSGNVITLVFETGAKLQSPQFPTTGAINGGVYDYITIDGGSNGIIENTDNGSVASGKTYNAASAGVYFNGGNTNIEVKNLTVQSIFINTGGNDSEATDSTGDETYCIRINNNGNWSDISIHDNTLNNSRRGISTEFEGRTASNLEIYDNYLEDHAWFFAVNGGSANNSSITGVDIHDNEYTNWFLWQYPTATYHTNGLIIFANGHTSCSYAGKFYNNYAHGNVGSGDPTGFIITGCGGDNFLIYNNLFVCDNVAGGESAMSCIAVYNAGGCQNSAGDEDDGVQPINTTFYNNTCIGTETQRDNANGYAVKVGRELTIPGGAGVYMTVKNNIFKSWNHPLHDVNAALGGFSGSGTADYNLYYDLYNYSGNYYAISNDNASTRKTVASFCTDLTQECSGLYNDPSLDANYKPDASDDPVVDAGVDLSAIFTEDIVGQTRPLNGGTSLSFDIGAYEYDGAASAAGTGTMYSGTPTEADIKNTGGYITDITFTGDTVIAAESFDAQRQNILDGFVPIPVYDNGWNVVIAATAVGAVERISDTVIRITWAAAGTFDIPGAITVTGTTPAGAATSGEAHEVSPSFVVTATQAASEIQSGCTGGGGQGSMN